MSVFELFQFLFVVLNFHFQHFGACLLLALVSLSQICDLIFKIFNGFSEIVHLVLFLFTLELKFSNLVSFL